MRGAGDFDAARDVLERSGAVSVSKHKDTNATEGVNAEGGNVERGKAADRRVERGKAAHRGIERDNVAGKRVERGKAVGRGVERDKSAGNGVDTAMQSAKPEPTKKSDRTRAALLTAALAIISKKGYSATTVDEICKQAGIAKGSVYYYFKTKEEIGACILQEQTTQLVALLQACKTAGAERDSEADSTHENAGHRTETKQHAHAGERAETGERSNKASNSVASVGAGQRDETGVDAHHDTNKGSDVNVHHETRAHNETALHNEVSKHQETDARQVLTAMLAAFSDFAFSNPPFTHFLMRELWREERAWSAKMQAREQEVIELIAQEIRLGQREGIYRKESDATFAAISIIGMVITNTLYATAPHTHELLTKEQFQQRVFDFSHAALCS